MGSAEFALPFCTPTLVHCFLWISVADPFLSYPRIRNPDPDTGGQLITYPSGVVSNLDIFVSNEKKYDVE
jgi:hypothetical protein